MDADKRVELMTHLVAGILASGQYEITGYIDCLEKDDIVNKAEKILFQIEDTVSEYECE